MSTILTKEKTERSQIKSFNMRPQENGEFLGSEDPTFWSHLGSLGIRGIELEKNRIRIERESLAAGTRTLAFENYRTFIAAAECGQDVAKHLDQVKISLSRSDHRLHLFQLSRSVQLLIDTLTLRCVK
jgi:hypothetical protein